MNTRSTCSPSIAPPNTTGTGATRAWPRTYWPALPTHPTHWCSRSRAICTKSLVPAGVHVDAAHEQVISVDVAHAGGTAWIQRGPDQCGPADMPGKPVYRKRYVELGEETGNDHGSGVFLVGTVSAAPPAKVECNFEETGAARNWPWRWKSAALRMREARPEQPEPFSGAISMPGANHSFVEYNRFGLDLDG